MNVDVSRRVESYDGNKGLESVVTKQIDGRTTNVLINSETGITAESAEFVEKNSIEDRKIEIVNDDEI
jgi:hypothetical protein